MTVAVNSVDPPAFPRWSACLQLLKPITWFPPMWAFGCGIASVTVADGFPWGLLLIGAVLCGPMVCGTSQAVNAEAITNIKGDVHEIKVQQQVIMTRQADIHTQLCRQESRRAES